MIFTRHLVILSSLLCVSLVLAWVFTMTQKTEPVSEFDDVMYLPASEHYDVVHVTAADNSNSSFIEKVRKALAKDPPEDSPREEVVIEAPALSNESYRKYSRPFVSAFPQVGAVYACTINSIDAPTPSQTPWIINEAEWDPSKKPRVDGAVLEYGSMSMSEDGVNRTLIFQGVPNHAIGVFPVRENDPTFSYGVNTYPVGVFRNALTVSSTPERAPAPSCIASDVVGVLNSGALLFRGIFSGGSDAGLASLTDSCLGHVDKLGRYHYHEESSCVATNSDGAIGYALDGFGIYGSLEEGREITNADLDACHGHAHSVIWNGKVTNIYHYHMTDEYPYSVGCFTGTPSQIVAQ